MLLDASTIVTQAATISAKAQQLAPGRGESMVSLVTVDDGRLIGELIVNYGLVTIDYGPLIVG